MYHILFDASAVAPPPILEVPELQGTWRAEDGSHGTFEGLKVPSLLGGQFVSRFHESFENLGLKRVGNFIPWKSYTQMRRMYHYLSRLGEK